MVACDRTGLLDSQAWDTHMTAAPPLCMRAAPPPGGDRSAEPLRPRQRDKPLRHQTAPACWALCQHSRGAASPGRTSPCVSQRARALAASSDSAGRPVSRARRCEQRALHGLAAGGRLRTCQGGGVDGEESLSARAGKGPSAFRWCDEETFDLLSTS